VGSRVLVVTDATGGLDDLFHVYDAAMRLWAESSLPEVAAWLDPALTGVPASMFQKKPTAFAAPVVQADLLVQVGPQKLMHVEYESSPDKDLVRRMYDYRGRIMREYPGFRLTQYVIVLGTGTVEGYDDLERFGFLLDVRVVYLREHDPADFLKDPLLAPFAVLGRGSRKIRAQSLGAAMRLLRDSGDLRVRVLLQVLDALAQIRLDRSTIERVRKESGLSIEPLVRFYKDTEVGLRLQDLGREKGREEGREEGRERSALALLRTRFGDSAQVRAAAQRFSHWDEAAAVEAIVAAPDVDTLLSMDPPAPA
jgi:hypothetical protein